MFNRTQSHTDPLPDVFTRLSRCIDIAADLDIPASGIFPVTNRNYFAKCNAYHGFTSCHGGFTMAASVSTLMVTSKNGEATPPRCSSLSLDRCDPVFAPRDWLKRFAVVAAFRRMATAGTHRACVAAGARLAVSAGRIIDFCYFTVAKAVVL